MPKATGWCCIDRCQTRRASRIRLARGPGDHRGGGRFIARGPAAHAYEAGIAQRTVIIEFESVAAADATYHSDAYQAALRWLDGIAERDVSIVEGVG